MSNVQISHYRSQTLLSDNYPTWRGKFFLTLCLLCILAFPSAATGNAPVLSASEIDYPPFCIVDDQGRAGGFSVELMRAALKAMGREVSFRTGPWAEVRGWLERGEVQALPLVGRTPEREFLFDFTFPYMSLHGAIVVRQDVKNIREINDLRGRTVAVMKGDNAEEFLRREERDIEIHTTATFEDAFQKLSEGRYDAVVIQRLVALRLIQETGLKNLKVIDHPIQGFRQDFCFAVKEGDRETLSLLNEGLALVMADGTYRHLHAKWFAALELPSHRRIVIGGDHNYPPYEFLDENGRPAGFIVELTQAVAREMNLDIQIRLGPWAEIVQALEKGEIDVVQGMFYSPERDLKFDFTQPHAANHYVGVVRRGEGDPPASIAELKGKRIVLQKGDIIHEYLVKKGLGDHVSLVETQEDVLRELAEGRYDCALAVRISSLYLIDKHGWSNLTLGQQPFISMEYCYAVPNNHKALLAQFSEGLKILDESGEYRRIQKKWLGVYKEDPVSLVRVLHYSAMVLIPLALLLLGFFLWSWSLRKQVAARTKALQESEEFQRAMIACSPVALFSIDLEGRVQAWNASAERTFGWTASEVLGHPLPIVPEDKQEEFAGLRRRLMERGAFSGVEVVRRKKDGTRFDAGISAAPIHDSGGDIIGIMAFVEDITERKRAEAALRESEAKYRLLVENQTDLVVKVDMEGRFLFASPSYCRMFGKKEENLLGKKFMPLVHEEDRDSTEEAMETLYSPPHTAYIEQRAMTKEGWLWLAWVDTAVPDSEGNVKEIIGVGRDITARKQVQEEIQKRDVQFRKLASQIPGMIYQFMQKPDGSFCVPFTSECIRDIFGCSPRDVKDDFSPIAKVILPEDLDLVINSIRESARKLTPWFCEYRVQIPGQPVRWMGGRSTPEKLDDGSIIWHGFNTDITERKQAEEALASNYTLLRIAGETAKFGGWSVDLNKNICTWSEKVADIHDVPRGYAPPVQDGINFYAPEWREKITQVFTDCAEKGIPYDEEMEIITRKGRRVWIRTTGEAVRDEKGEIVKVEGSFQDITERKRAEEEREKLQAQFNQAQKMESVGRLAGGVAHDYNNMLSVIIGNAELALSRTVPVDPLYEELREIIDAARRSTDITRQLLAFARKQTIRPEVLDLNETMEGMLKMLRRLIGENIDLSWRPGTGLWPVKMDHSQLDQVIANLLVNARDAISLSVPQGSTDRQAGGMGKVTIETDNVTFDEAYCADHAGFVPGEFVLLAVSDDGCGMDKETLDNLFEPFFTTKGVGEGSGLGMATVYGIVKQNDGFINVYSEPEKGTTFKIYLPRHEGEAEKTEKEDPVEIPSGVGETVLIVEDEISVLKLSKRILGRLGYTMLEASTPGEAVEIAGEHKGGINLLITDVVMPEMNGRDLAGKLQALYPDLRVLFMSGYTANVIAHRGVLDEGVHFMQKPFSNRDLAVKVREALDGHSNKTGKG